MLDEYIDLRKLIKKMQDIDKLKLILLTKSQRFFFDMIPKPQLNEEIEGNNRNKLENMLTKTKLKQATKKEIIDNYEDISRNINEADKNMLELINSMDLPGLNLTSFGKG